MKRDFTEQQSMGEMKRAEFLLKNLGLTFIKPKFYNVDKDTIATETESLENIDSDVYSNSKDIKSKFGLPIFDAIRFESVRYTSNTGLAITVPTFDIGTVLCEINQSRNIVKTVIAGKDGCVKEYIGKGDYEITIQGVLASEFQNVPPKDALTNLLGFCDAPLEFDIASNYLAYFGIYTIVVEDYSFKQLEGQRNTIAFKLKCLSDFPYEIKIND
ncbi:MAG: DUF6046 domain-containing protein [Bacteroidia bacterium]